MLSLTRQEPPTTTTATHAATAAEQPANGAQPTDEQLAISGAAQVSGPTSGSQVGLAAASSVEQVHHSLAMRAKALTLEVPHRPIGASLSSGAGQSLVSHLSGVECYATTSTSTVAASFSSASCERVAKSSSTATILSSASSASCNVAAESAATTTSSATSKRATFFQGFRHTLRGRSKRRNPPQAQQSVASPATPQPEVGGVALANSRVSLQGGGGGATQNMQQSQSLGSIPTVEPPVHNKGAPNRPKLTHSGAILDTAPAGEPEDEDSGGGGGNMLATGGGGGGQSKSSFRTTTTRFSYQTATSSQLATTTTTSGFCLTSSSASSFATTTSDSSPASRSSSSRLIGATSGAANVDKQDNDSL